MKKNPKQLAAIAGIGLLVTLYLFTFVTAFLQIENWDRLFMASLVATVGIPILIWIYIWIYQKITDQRAQADDNDNSQPDD